MKVGFEVFIEVRKFRDNPDTVFVKLFNDAGIPIGSAPKKTRCGFRGYDYEDLAGSIVVYDVPSVRTGKDLQQLQDKLDRICSDFMDYDVVDIMYVKVFSEKATNEYVTAIKEVQAACAKLSKQGKKCLEAYGTLSYGIVAEKATPQDIADVDNIAAIRNRIMDIKENRLK